MKPPSGPKKQTQTKPISISVYVNIGNYKADFQKRNIMNIIHKQKCIFKIKPASTKLAALILCAEDARQTKKRLMTPLGHQSLLFHCPVYGIPKASPQLCLITLKECLISY
ncbi:hypothetical protein ES703_76075 [subsurface metagenome]